MSLTRSGSGLTRSALPQRAAYIGRAPIPVAGRPSLFEPSGPAPNRADRRAEEAQARKARSRRDTIPPAVRKLVSHRDLWCMRCGSANHLHSHHRRLKGIGGDTRPHTDCSCNLVRLCATCHGEVHGKDRRAAGDEGFIVPAETVLPGSVSVLVRTADGGLAKYASCDGRWLDEPQDEAAA